MKHLPLGVIWGFLLGIKRRRRDCRSFSNQFKGKAVFFFSVCLNKNCLLRKDGMKTLETRPNRAGINSWFSLALGGVIKTQSQSAIKSQHLESLGWAELWDQEMRSIFHLQTGMDGDPPGQVQVEFPVRWPLSCEWHLLPLGWECAAWGFNPPSGIVADSQEGAGSKRGPLLRYPGYFFIIPSRLPKIPSLSFPGLESPFSIICSLGNEFLRGKSGKSD